MIVFLSPSKTFTKKETLGTTVPIFKEKTDVLLNHMSALEPLILKKILKVSDKLLNEVTEFYKNPNDLVRAIDRFGGIVYTQLNQTAFINSNQLYILDAYYGLLRPSDQIMKYRLDFTVSHKLYDYWRKDISHYLLTNHPNDLCVDLSSKEFSSLIPNGLNVYKIDFMLSFKKLPNTQLKILRGKMAQYILSNQLDTLEDLKKIVLEDFKYDDTQSSDKRLVFIK